MPRSKTPERKSKKKNKGECNIKFYVISFIILALIIKYYSTLKIEL